MPLEMPGRAGSYYGWRVVGATMAVYTLVMGVTYSCYGMFVLPVAEEYGLSRADANSGLIILNVGVAVFSPFLGRVLDIVAARTIMILSSLAFIAGYAMLSLSSTLWVGVAVYALIMPFAIKGTGTLTGPLLVARWFTVRRGRAMTLSQLGYSGGGLLLPPIVGYLIGAFGWRTALLAAGVGAGLLLLGIALLIREKPEPGELEAAPPQPASAISPVGPPDAATPVARILMVPQFWALSLSCGLTAGASQGLLVSFVPLGQEQGLPLIQAATLISAMSASGIAAKLLVALVADRIDRVVLLTVMFLAGAALNFGLVVCDGYAQLLVVAIGLGIATSAILPMIYAVAADRLGVANFGVVVGLIVPVTAVCGVVFIRAAGEIYDRTGGYDLLCMLFGVVHVIAAALICSSRTKPANRLTAHQC